MTNIGGIRFRTYIIGILFSVIVILMATYSDNVLRASSLAIDHMPAGGIFIFFLIVLLINPLLSILKRTYELNPEELLVIYIMLLVVSSITTMGLGGQLLPQMAAPYYYASPENRWAEIIHPHLRDWLHPTGERTVQHFFEGLPSGESIPWLSWIRPIMAWFVLIFALYMVMVFLMVILRKQWVENEKLTYPLVQLPLEMVKNDEKESRMKPLFRNKLLWIGFAIPFLISSINALHSYFHFIPNIELIHGIRTFQRTMTLSFRISFPIIGFAYFVNQEVALGVWFFNLVYHIFRGIFNVTGVSLTETLSVYGAGSPIFKNFGAGAFLTFVSMGFWMARRHLKDVFGAAFGKRSVDDSNEIVSYKAAVWGMLLGLVIIIGWLMMSGMPLGVAILFVIFMFVFFIGLTRIIAEAGIATMISPSIAADQVLSSVGSQAISPQGVTALGLTFVYASDVRTFPMSAAAQGLKLSERINLRRKGGMFAAIVIAICVAYFVSNWLVLWYAYRYGGINMGEWYFVGGAQTPYRLVASHLIHPGSPTLFGWGLRAAGAVVMGVLMFMRYHFLWWPFHPLGFAVGSVLWIDYLWFSIFIAWLIKAVTLKYGGLAMFRKGRFFFLGLILGQYSAAGTWFIIDFFTGHVGNRVFHI